MWPTTFTAPSATELSPPLRLNLGCGRNVRPGWINLDTFAGEGIDLVYDLDRCAHTPLPLADSCVDEFLLSHVLEHVNNTLPLMAELHRVARPGAQCTIRVPHGASDDAWTDPTHVRPYFTGSFGYFGQPFYWRADYGYRGDWKTEKLVLRMSKQHVIGKSNEEILHAIQYGRNIVSEMTAILVAIKPARQPLAELQTPPALEIEVD